MPKLNCSKSFGQSITPLTDLKINVTSARIRRSKRHKPLNRPAVLKRTNFYFLENRNYRSNIVDENTIQLQLKQISYLGII